VASVFLDMAVPSPDAALPGSFPSTHWTWIQAGEDPAARARALEHLARLYWRPIRAYLRASLRKDEEQSLDLTQDFFVWTIESGFLSKADRSRGRFRAFLKTALRNYVAHADERASARKRGGGVRFVSLPHGDEGEDALPPLPDGRARMPEEILDEAWRSAVVRAAVERTRDELERDGRGTAFAVFRAWFLEEGDDVDHRAIAERHGISKVDVANHLARAKRAYKEHLRELVRETVGSGPDLEEELTWLAGGERS
jgi:DNA-directed RNA polymerase specialized sigma24 family protein